MPKRAQEPILKSDIEALERMARANLNKLKIGPKPKPKKAPAKRVTNLSSKKRKEIRDKVGKVLKDIVNATSEPGIASLGIDDVEIIGDVVHSIPASVRREIEVGASSLLDDPEALAREDERREYFDDRNLSISLERKALERRKVEEAKYMFENVKPEEIPAIIKRICTFKATNVKVDQLAYAVKKFKTYAADATKQLELPVDFSMLPDPEKLKAIAIYGVKNPVVNFHEHGDKYFWDYIKEIIQTCFPLLTFKRTRCNPAAFNLIVLEEIIIPNYRIKDARHVWTWFSNRGDKLQRRMNEKMTEIVFNRLKKAQAE